MHTTTTTTTTRPPTMTVHGIAERLTEMADRLDRHAGTRPNGELRSYDRLDALALRNIAAELIAHGSIRRPTPYSMGD